MYEPCTLHIHSPRRLGRSAKRSPVAVDGVARQHTIGMLPTKPHAVGISFRFERISAMAPPQSDSCRQTPAVPLSRNVQPSWSASRGRRPPNETGSRTADVRRPSDAAISSSTAMVTVAAGMVVTQSDEPGMFDGGLGLGVRCWLVWLEAESRMRASRTDGRQRLMRAAVRACVFECRFERWKCVICIACQSSARN